MKTTAELLAQFQADNLRLVAENLKLRSQKRKLKQAYVKRVDKHFLKCCIETSAMRLLLEELILVVGKSMNGIDLDYLLKKSGYFERVKAQLEKCDAK